MTRDVFLVKIVPPRGYDVYRLRVSRRGGFALAAGVLLALLVALALHAWQLHLAEADVSRLEAQAAAQNAAIGAVDRQADQLAAQLRALQRENAEIRALIGLPSNAGTPQRPSHGSVRVPVRPDALAAVHARLTGLASVSQAAARDEQQLVGLAGRVVELRRLANLARDRMIAAVPSIQPVDGTVVSGFGYRFRPWPEFHEGVDIAADYGTPVRAAAAGTVVAAGWDSGGFGIKVDIDHGNGYHTWYGHLSRVAVTAGQRVVKGQTIAAVGATGEATGPHLHYQVMRFGAAVNPAPYLNGVPHDVLATLR